MRGQQLGQGGKNWIGGQELDQEHIEGVWGIQFVCILCRVEFSVWCVSWS